MSKKAIDEAKRYGRVHIAAGLTETQGLIEIQPEDAWTLTPHAAYVHYTPNETISGIRFPDVPLTAMFLW